MNLWDEWRKHRLEFTGVYIKPLSAQDNAELQHWLTRFVLEVRKKDGYEFTPNSLHHICCGLMRHLRWNGKPKLDIFTDGTFSAFKQTLDSEMK